MLTGKRTPISRRAFLRGAGAILALPFLEGMLPALDHAVKPPLRMGIWTVTGGTVIESWRPKEVGKLETLPSILRPLEAVKDDVVVVSGLAHNGQGQNVNGHENCAFMHLTGAPHVRKVGGRITAGVSVDQAAARALGEDTYLPSLEFGLTNGETRYSFRSAESIMPYESNPRLVFERMFRGRKPIVPNWQKRAEAQSQTVRGTAKPDSIEQSVVDLVREDANDLKRKLGGADRQRFEEYLHAVRSVERRIERMDSRERLEALDAANPGPSTVNLPAIPQQQAFQKLYHALFRDPEAHGDYIRLMADLLVLAFQTDTTRVATFACGDDGALFPGVITVGYERHCHTLEHQGNAGRVEDADPIAREALRQIHFWYTEMFAEMARKMKTIDEGGSTLLDNSLILYTSYMADGGHGTHNYPALLAGRAGGALRGGRHLAYKDRTPMSNLYVEMLNLMGMKVDEFGESRTSKHAAHDGRLPGLVS